MKLGLKYMTGLLQQQSGQQNTVLLFHYTIHFPLAWKYLSFPAIIPLFENFMTHSVTRLKIAFNFGILCTAPPLLTHMCQHDLNTTCASELKNLEVALLKIEEVLLLTMIVYRSPPHVTASAGH
jgi:hypothetical protein